MRAADRRPQSANQKGKRGSAGPEWGQRRAAPQALPHHRGLAAAGAARSAAWSTTTVGPAPSGTGPTQPSGLFVVARLSLAVLTGPVVHIVGGGLAGDDLLERCQRIPVCGKESQVVSRLDVLTPRGGAAPGVLGCAGLMYRRTLFTLDGVAIAV